jgi:hypothetical protein
LVLFGLFLLLGACTLLPTTHDSVKMKGGCDIAKRCEDMKDCQEAQYYLNTCNQTHLDKNHDGIPCENVGICK